MEDCLECVDSSPKLFLLCCYVVDDAINFLHLTMLPILLLLLMAFKFSLLPVELLKRTESIPRY